MNDVKITPFYFNIIWNAICICNLSSHYQFSVSHDPSEINILCWFGAKKNISSYQFWKQLCCLINQYLCIYFVETVLFLQVNIALLYINIALLQHALFKW